MVKACAHRVCLEAGREHLYLSAGVRWGPESSLGLGESLELSVSLSEVQVLYSMMCRLTKASL